MMKQENLFKKLGNILNELNEQYQFLSQNPEKLNELELELFHANANFLADHVQIIKKLNSNQEPLALPEASIPVTETVGTFEDIQIKEEPEAVEAIVEEELLAVADVQEIEELEEIVEEEEPEVIEPTVAKEEVFKLDMTPSSFEFILNENAEVDKFDFEEEIGVGEMFDRPLTEEEQKVLEQKRKVKEKIASPPAELEEDEIGPEPFLVKEEETPQVKIKKEDLTLVEKAEPKIATTIEPVEDPNYKPTLNDILAGKNGASNNVNQTNTAAVRDLKQAISLNDKLLYIKDLFNGYNLAYAEAIDLANKLPNFEAADQFFQKNYAGKNNWADKQSTVDKFYKLLNQRFKTS